MCGLASKTMEYLTSLSFKECIICENSFVYYFILKKHQELYIWWFTKCTLSNYEELYLQRPMQSVSITTDIVISYSIQHYVIKFVSDLRQVGNL